MGYKFISGQTEDTGYTRIIIELANEYVAQHPNVKFEFESYPQAGLQRHIQPLAASNALLTIFPNPANETLAAMIDNGRLSIVRYHPE